MLCSGENVILYRDFREICFLKFAVGETRYVIRMVAPGLRGGGVKIIWLPACPLHRKISAFFSEIDVILVSQHHSHQNRRNSAKFRKKSVKFSRKYDKSAFFRENLQNDAEFWRKSSKNSEKSEKSGMVQRNSCRS